jgi:hypothetical protein
LVILLLKSWKSEEDWSYSNQIQIKLCYCLIYVLIIVKQIEKSLKLLIEKRFNGEEFDWFTLTWLDGNDIWFPICVFDWKIIELIRLITSL